MSLINDMLRDLDRRKCQPAGACASTLRGLGLAGGDLEQALAACQGTGNGRPEGE